MKVHSITIVGGGTSAWLTAAYLYKNQPDISITVVDKEVGNAIGVGEATLLSFKHFMEECGFTVEDWFVPVSAGYKSGILFTNWREPGNNIWHPFAKGNRKIKNKLSVWNVWSNHQEFDFKTYATGLYDSSIKHNAVDPYIIENYAFHVDCGKLVLFLQEKLKNKFKVIKSEVVNVVRSSDDIVDHLELKNGEKIYSNLYVDCTGFNNILRTSTKKVDITDRLFVNTAVVCQVPYEDRPNEFKPYAICDAVDHGWLWKIGVDSRIGSGMVFNRFITNPEEAKEYFVNYWNNRIKKENVRVINWDPFYLEDPWQGNVVNIGLSAGFIEPLESTGIGLITAGITQLNNAVQERIIIKDDIEFFNLQARLVFEDCVDFVSMHYANNNRTSKFWQYVKDTFKPSTRMLNQLEELSNPDILMPFNGRHNYMFGGSNWSIVLQQLGYPVAPRNINVPKDLSLEMLVSTYIEHEKNRHIWSRHHSAEVDRIKELKKL